MVRQLAGHVALSQQQYQIPSTQRPSQMAGCSGRLGLGPFSFPWDELTSISFPFPLSIASFSAAMRAIRQSSMSVESWPGRRCDGYVFISALPRAALKMEFNKATGAQRGTFPNACHRIADGCWPRGWQLRVPDSPRECHLVFTSRLCLAIYEPMESSLPPGHSFDRLRRDNRPPDDCRQSEGVGMRGMGLGHENSQRRHQTIPTQQDFTCDHWGIDENVSSSFAPNHCERQE